MQKILTTVFALGALGAMAWYVMYRPTKDTVIQTEETSAPKRQLDNVRAKAKDIERQQEEHLQHVDQRVNGDGTNAPAE